MSQEQLDQAYDLIKAGDKQAAIDILEPLIRAERDNDDAWWLLANATDDPAAKRNALNNVLRIGTNPTREARAHEMLDILENARSYDASDEVYDDYNLHAREEEATRVTDDSDSGYAAAQAHDRPTIDTPRKSASSSNTGCATLGKVLAGVLVMFGVCACAACFGSVALVQGLIEAPDESAYDMLGMIEIGETVEGRVGDQDWDAYRFEGTAGETVRFELTGADVDQGNAPVIALVYQDGSLGFLPDSVRNYNNDGRESLLTLELPETDEYLVLVRTIFSDETSSYTLRVR